MSSTPRRTSRPIRGAVALGARAGAGAGAGVALLSRLAGRIVSAGGAVLVFGSLTLAWFAVRGAGGGERAVDAWENYTRTDLLLAGLAVAALVAAVVPWARVSATARLGIGLAVALVVLRAVGDLPLSFGPRTALLGAAAVGAGAAIDLLGGRGGALGRRVLGGSEWAGARVEPLILSPLVLAPFAVLITWPVKTLGVGGGTDGSWITGLAMAAHHGLNFGSDIVYTYGPLGFLTVPRLYYPALTLLGVLYVALVQTALAATLLTLLRERLHILGAFVVTLLVLSALRLASPDEHAQTAFVALAFVWCVALLRSPARVPSRLDWLFFAGSGALAAIAVLIKLGTGATIFALFALTALLARPERRFAPFGVYLGAFSVSLLALWGVTGQVLTDLPLYALRSAEVVAGYAGYMQREEDGRQWEYSAALLSAVAVFAVAWAGTGGWDRVRRATALLLTALFLFSWFKQGFVRHDSHSLLFFASALCAALAFVPGLRGREGRALAVVAACGLLAAFLGAARLTEPSEFLKPRNSTGEAFTTFQQLRSPSDFREQSRAELRAWEEVDPETLALLRGRTVHIWPSEAAVAYAHPEFEWRPLPVFQGYVAYTGGLDQVNADFLLSDEAPERILRSNEYSPFESPAALVTMFCHYREIRAGERWQVLERVPNRCGDPELIESVRRRTGEPVPIPAASSDELVFARVHGLEPELGEQLRGLVWKPRERGFIYDNGRSGGLAATSADHPIPLEVGRAADFSTPFHLDPDAQAITFVAGTSEELDERPLRVDFYRMAVRAPSRAPAGA